ncbi:MAG: hypothetical protein CM15mP66_02990 [Pseudomonadota bacterium]|nr:MAG: hypothetical protein CM15mP66_02990 [Pseudomonadota bacterium]
MDKTRLALIGVGMIGKRHLKAMRDVEEAELAALVDHGSRSFRACQRMVGALL